MVDRDSRSELGVNHLHVKGYDPMAQLVLHSCPAGEGGVHVELQEIEALAALCCMVTA